MTLDPYDALAPHYRETAAKRASYIAAVDNFVIANARPGGRHLDIGSGDGVRAADLAKKLKASSLTLCEPSQRMAALCRALNAGDVWETSADVLPATESRFDLITCLWNVFGHMRDAETRVAALRAIADVMAPGALLFFDVNNRHNARAYGVARVMWRRVVDTLNPDDRRGDTSFTWDIGGARIPAMGHLFTPAECQRLLTAAGFECLRRVAIDYATGAVSDTPTEGQLVFQARVGGAR